MSPATPITWNAALARLRRAVEQLLPELTAAEWARFQQGVQLRTLPRHAWLQPAGQVPQQLDFIVTGLVRAYSPASTEAGEDGEVTHAFFQEGDYAADYPALLSQRPSRYALRCLEPTTLLTLSYPYIQAGYRQFAGLERYGRLMDEEAVKLLQARLEGFQLRTAEQRYLHFVRTRPALFQRVTLAHLASYLGVQRPSLSRIRRKLAAG